MPLRLDIPVKRHQTDVLIVGGGAAGTMAAFECADAGVAVTQVTKGRATSGTTTVARGGFAAAMGDDDSPELHLQDILKHGGELIDPALARVWVYDIVGVVNDLESCAALTTVSTSRRFPATPGTGPAITTTPPAT
jgi:succinate dehydrogenase/fumarate reductase flavoprotein subunit